MSRLEKSAAMTSIGKGTRLYISIYTARLLLNRRVSISGLGTAAVIPPQAIFAAPCFGKFKLATRCASLPDYRIALGSYNFDDAFASLQQTKCLSGERERM